MSINRVTLMGRLTREIELRSIGTAGTKVASFGLALSEYYKNQAGEQVETAHFFEIVTWGKQAEVCAKYLVKGQRVILEGKLQHDRWESEDGAKKSRVKVRAERVHFLDTPKKQTDSADPAVARAAL